MLGVFILVNLGVYAALALWPMRFHYTDGDTDALLPVIQRNTPYGFLMLGTSHGRIFSTAGNHARVESALGTTFLNLAKGNGEGSIFEEELFLKWFYDRGNSTPTIIYLIDPWTFYSRQWNEGNDFLQDEPFNLAFLARAYQAGTDTQVLVNYIKSKVYPSWVLQMPREADALTGTVPTVDPVDVQKRISALYLDGTNPATFAVYAQEMRSLVALAEAHGTRVICIVPATLLGRLPGQDVMLVFLRTLPGVIVHDLSASILDQKYFYNLDHLNTEGILLFTQKFLKPLLQTASTTTGT